MSLEVIDVLRDEILQWSPGRPIAMYLQGSACEGGLRPDSDLDVVLLTRDSLDSGERRLLVDCLLCYSGRHGGTPSGRPIELTSLVLTDVVPWRYPAFRDFLYGEWRRNDYEAGYLPRRELDPNLPVLLTSGRQRARALLGPPMADLTDAVPATDLARSMFDALPELLRGLHGDERNVLLTLARMVYTLRTGRIASKDTAAYAVAATLPAAAAATLDHAAASYLGQAQDDWSTRRPESEALAEALVAAIDAFRQ